MQPILMFFLILAFLFFFKGVFFRAEKFLYLKLYFIVLFWFDDDLMVGFLAFDLNFGLIIDVEETNFFLDFEDSLVCATAFLL